MPEASFSLSFLFYDYALIGLVLLTGLANGVIM